MQVVRGKQDQIRLAVCCLLTEGHLLIDDVPGTGKTSLAKAIAGSIAGTWKRVQFTPDLLPTDITGVSVFDQSVGHVQLPRGPGVHQRADRRRDQPGQPEDPVGAARGDGGAPGHHRRRQPAGAPTVLRHRHREPSRLPGHVPAARRAARPLHDADQPRLRRPRAPRSACSSGSHRHRRDDLLEPGHRHRPARPADRRRSTRSRSSRSVHDYIVRLATATRRHPDLRLGVSTRGTLSMLRVARAFAATDDRDFVTPDDVRAVVGPVFAHRMALTAEAELRGVADRRRPRRRRRRGAGAARTTREV